MPVQPPAPSAAPATAPLGRRRDRGDVRSAAPPLPVQPARLRPPHHQLRRRQHVGQDPHAGSADRRRGRRPLGEGLGRRHRQHEDGRLRHALSRQAARAEEALSRPRARGRDGRLLPALHLQPQSAGDQHRYAAALLHAGPPHRSHARRRADRVRRGEERRGADQAGLRRRDRLDSLDASGLRAGPALRGAVPGQPADAGPDLRQPRPGQLGRHVEGVLPAHHQHHRARRGLARRQRQGRAVRPAGRRAAWRRAIGAPSSPSSGRCSAAC